MRKHRVQFSSWETVSSHKAKGHQVLGCQWVFKYKTDKHSREQKCKARLVVSGNQQKHHDILTRTTTLAITFLRVLLALTVKFNQETIQFVAVNAFVYAGLDKTVFIRMPPGYGENGKILRLNKALYGLRRSPLLWQEKLMKELKKLGFEEIPQEPCVVQRNRIIGFFYVDDVVFAYKIDQNDEIDRVVESFQRALTIKKVGELKWF